MATSSSFRKLATGSLRLLIVAAAALSAIGVWKNLEHFPRTEDAEVRANTVGVAPQVGGTITALHVVDNQEVKRGDLLFELDARPFEAEVARAKARLELVRMEVKALGDEIAAADASLGDRSARAAYAASHYERLKPLLEGKFTSADRVQRAQSEAESATALVKESQAAAARARNNLGDFEGRNTRIDEARATLRDAELRASYGKVYAPCDGYVTNLQISPGAYAATGEQIFSIVDSSVWFALANFRETDLGRIRPGQTARVFLMAHRSEPLTGIVQGISRAVYPLTAPSRATAGGQGILSKVDPTFDFIQLAQRFPVRIILQGKPRTDWRMGGRAAVLVDTESQPDEKRLLRLQFPEKKPFAPPVP